jgi:PAS domain S-box-containing protein
LFHTPGNRNWISPFAPTVIPGKLKDNKFRFLLELLLILGVNTMTEPGQTDTTPIRVRRFLWGLTLFWTIAMAITLTWELIDEHNQAMNIALTKAQSAWEKEVAIFRWDSASGGIYIPVTKNIQPDPFLTQVPDRDIATPSGKKLTLVGPAAIVRGIRKLAPDQFDLEGRFTSLRPIAPENEPNPWEKKALEEFEKGEAEASTLESIGGKDFLRYMRPLFTESSCLQCHEERAYKAGDLRGGLSTSVSMTNVWSLERQEIWHRIVGYGGMWVLGLCGMALMSKQLKRQINRRYQAERELQQANVHLEQRVAQRTADLAEANRLLENEISERKQAERWLLESEQRFRGYFEQGLVGMAILSPELDWVEVNQRLCKMLGYAEEELFLKRWSELTHPDDWPNEEVQFRRMTDKIMKGYIMEKRFIRKDKQILHANLSVQCMRREDGTADCVLALVQEIKDS